MAFLKVDNVKIVGVSAAVPSKIEYTLDYDLFSTSECKKFIDSVGVKERRVVDKDICTSDLCLKAAMQLLEDLNWQKDEIDLLVFVSHTPDYKLPATSCLLQNRLGLNKNCMTLDISLGCSGYTHGLQVVSSILSSGSINKALLLVGNTQTKYASYYDKSVYPLFADAGSATALQFSSNCLPMYFGFGTDGSGAASIIVKDGGCRYPVSQESFDYVEKENGNKLTNLHEYMDGLEVFAFGINTVPKEIKLFLDNFNININNIEVILFHQANKLMIQKIANKLNIPQEKMPMNIDRFGNTSCATIPLLMVTEMVKGNYNDRSICLLSGFGVGLSWGNCIVDLSEVFFSDLIEI